MPVYVDVDGVGRWVFGSAKWDQFEELSEHVIAQVDMRGDVDCMNNWLRTALVGQLLRLYLRVQGGGGGKQSHSGRRSVGKW